ncbi:GH36-type glycosyl hydrolase domain-containing protein [Tessaracoccus caeni]|uniref:GH36-type glycosyl hydrolase domain-containing protein n=1 Tax=Tessaracoccus caeni TaxID=3031239 RepID=UPI0023DA2F1A|nr:hypothetical protein [Tessaracoccus caeni]MDF1486952.1 hypothetical protein [Tessaracoccus caeni]
MADLLAPLHPSTPLEDGLAGLWLRERVDGEESLWRPMDLSRRRSGVAEGLRWTWRREAQESGWSTEILVTNLRSEPVEFDLLCVEDPSLSPPEVLEANRLYPSQYLDVTPLDLGDRGTGLAIRQNMPGPRTPWALLGSYTPCVAWATDALQLLGRGLPEGAPWPGLRRDLPSERLQHEHALAALQTEAITLRPGERWRGGFFLIHLDDHPEATTASDAARATSLALKADVEHPVQAPVDEASESLVGREAAYLPVRALSDEELSRLVPGERRHPEIVDGRTLGWFTADGDLLVTAAKQAIVLRPHGQILRPLGGLTPDEHDVTSTVWMDGGFCTHLTQGHAARGRILSSRLTPLGIGRIHGLRILVDLGRGWQLLGTPSAWLSGVDKATWWYATGGHLLQVSTGAPGPDGRCVVAVSALVGEPVPAMVALSFDWSGAPGALGPVAVNGVSVIVAAPEGSLARAANEEARLEILVPDGAVVADDGPLFADGSGRGEPIVTVAVAPMRQWSVSLLPRTTQSQGESRSVEDCGWDDVHTSVAVRSASPGPASDLLSRIDQMTGWYAHDAIVHYLSPRGLEQHTGGAWGTRDVAQGPVGLLRSWGEHAAWRDLLITVFGAQRARGDWSQAIEFLPGFTRAAEEPHGDVVYWPLLALGQYLGATGDTSVLDAMVAFGDAPGRSASLIEHVGRALDLIESTFIDGTSLPAYGHGDWNDSLQPANSELTQRMVSTWTVVLQIEALGRLAAGLATASPEVAQRSLAFVEASKEQLRNWLLLDGVLAGYGVAEGPGRFRPLIHPRDDETGLTYSLLPMIHAISGDLLTIEEATRHLSLIEQHLTGPDGARLFDRPVAYRGGPMTVFRRAEAASFFGREIGLMYLHAHIRYAEALARIGDGPALLRAMARAVPVGIEELVPSAMPRQVNAYSSSSDAAFADRYEAADDYRRALAGEVPLEAGWRVYSSGPGLFLEILTQRMLGIRHAAREIEIDPVLDPQLGTVGARLPVLGGPLEVEIVPGEKGHGLLVVEVDGRPVPMRALANPYRTAGVTVSADDLRGARKLRVVTL